MEEIALQIEQIATRANAWCNFAIVTAWIGFALSMFSLIVLIVRIRNERDREV